MNTPTSTPDRDTWEPAWKRNPKFGPLLNSYSTAAVVRGGERSQPELWDICNGSILWLPPRADLGDIPDPNLAKQNSAFFDHPILVLNIEVTNARSATVQFAKMTSLGKRPLTQMSAVHRDGYLPIFPSARHPNSGILLYLENNERKRGMPDISYVSIGEGVFSLDYKALRCYAAGQKGDGYRQRLTEESFNQVMGKLGRSSSAWIETGGLWEEFLSKHVPIGQ